MSGFVVTLFLSLLAAAPESAAEAPKLSEEEVAEGFQILFNGKDLSGFREVQGQPGAFVVEDGILLGKRGGAKAYWLSTRKRYADFEIRLEYMLEPGGNSGIFLRVPHYVGRSSSLGMEVQLLDDKGKTGTPSKHETGAIYRVDAASKYASNAAGEWNKLAIKCVGDQIQIMLNGELINDFDMTSSSATKNRPREGFIGLSAHTKTVRFRNIRIKDLGTDEVS